MLLTRSLIAGLSWFGIVFIWLKSIVELCRCWRLNSWTLKDKSLQMVSSLCSIVQLQYGRGYVWLSKQGKHKILTNNKTNKNKLWIFTATLVNTEPSWSGGSCYMCGAHSAITKASLLTGCLLLCLVDMCQWSTYLLLLHLWALFA